MAAKDSKKSGSGDSKGRKNKATTAMKATEAGEEKHIIDEIYDKIVDLFGNPNQLFCMEFPGRVLNESLYAFKTDSIFSEITKPQPVVEEEFRMTDDLFDVGQITGGPMGKKLSSTYELALNMLVPKYYALPDFNKDQETIRSWLLGEVEEEIEGKVVKCTRMQLYQKLNNIYQTAKAKWEDEKTKRLSIAMKDENPHEALDEYSRWLAREAPVMEAKLDAMFEELVVRGYYHKVRTLLGYLDIASENEELEQTKARLRATSMSSLDESETIYPVQLEPVDWFAGLNTDFTPQDLLLDPEFIEDKLFEKEQELDDLESQYASLEAAHTGDEKELQEEVDKAQKAYDEAQTEMIKNFSNATITAVQMYFEHRKQKGEEPSLDDFKKSEEGKKGGPLSQEEWDKIKELQNKTIDNQRELISSSRALANLQAAKAAAEATDAKQALIVLKSRIDVVSSEVKHLKAILYSNANRGQGKEGDDTLPSGMPPAGKFMDVTFSFSTSQLKKKSDLETGSSQTSWGVDLLFGSAGGSKSKAWSNFSDENMDNSQTLDMGFRVTKVTIDRGGWFDPEFFGLSKSMFSFYPENKVSLGKPSDLTSFSADTLKKYNSTLLPAYPVAFVIAKDVTIKFKAHKDSTENVKNILDSQSSIGGGFLCFSASHSESSHKTSMAFYHSVEDQMVTIKIPGPQILGWFLEFIPEDTSTNYSRIPDGYLPSGGKEDNAVKTEDE